MVKKCSEEIHTLHSMDLVKLQYGNTCCNVLMYYWNLYLHGSHDRINSYFSMVLIVLEITMQTMKKVV